MTIDDFNQAEPSDDPLDIPEPLEDWTEPERRGARICPDCGASWVMNTGTRGCPSCDWVFQSFQRLATHAPQPLPPRPAIDEVGRRW
jgi:hypothetical protein